MGHLDRGLSGQVPGEETALDRQGGGALAGEAAGVVDGDGGPAGQFLGQYGVLGGVRLPGRGPQGQCDAQGGAAGPQGHGQDGADGFAEGTVVRGPGLVDAHPPVELRVAGAAEDDAALAHRPGGRAVGRVDLGAAQVHGGGGEALGGGDVGHPAQRGVLGRRRRARFLGAEDPVEQVDGGEGGEARHEEPGQFLGGADDVEGRADGAGRVQQGEPFAGAVLLTALQRGHGDGGERAGGVVDRPDLHRPGVQGGAGRRGRVALVLDAPAGVGDDAQVVQEGPGVALEVAQRVGQTAAEQCVGGPAHQPARGLVDVHVAQVGVDDGHRQGCLAHGVADQGGRRAAGRVGGHRVAAVFAVGAQQRSGPQPQAHRTALPVPDHGGADGDGGGQRAGGQVPREQVPCGAPHDLLGRVSGEPPRAVAPPRHQPAGVDDRRGGGILHAVQDHARTVRYQPGRGAGGPVTVGERAARRGRGRRGRSS